jgi:predicted nucleic acid-binding protein
VAQLICVDASLTLKLVLPEPDSATARRLWQSWAESEVALIAPPLWRYEVTSVIRNRVYRGKLSPDIEEETITFLYSLPIQILNPEGLHQRAWQIARYFNRPAAYDAHYLALAELTDASFWTSDERLYNAVHAEITWIHWLASFSSNGGA